MKSLFKIPFVFICSAFLVVSCESSFDSLVDQRLEDNPVPPTQAGDPGSADFSNYVAIGNSLTAGFMDAALYNNGQQHSFPSMIADKLEFAGAPETFNQPDINSELGFNTSVTQPQDGTVLGRFKLDTNIPGPSPTIGGDPIGSYTGDTGKLDNFGVPGIVVGQLLTPATGGPQSDPAFNPFYSRFASNPGSSTILGDAIATQPTFFTLWIGSNDLLNYATSGASNPNLLTSDQDFTTFFTGTISQLMNNTSAKGVVATIPPILGLPFFQAVPYNPIPLDAQTAQQLNMAYSDYNDGLQQAALGGFITQDEADRRTIHFEEGNNAFVMNDETLTDLSALGLPNIRQAEPTDLQILPLGALLGQDQGNGPIGLEDPVKDNMVLLPSEQQEIQSSLTFFNTTIATAVAQNSDRLALFDINSGFPGNPNTEMGALADLFGIDGTVGININGTTLQPDFSPGGVFSTDGIHPNPRGNAILANEFIKVIEENFGASIPKVDVLNLPSVQLCAGNCVSEQQKQTANTAPFTGIGSH